MSFDYPIAFNVVKLMAVIARVGAFTIALPIFNSDIISGTYKYFFILVLSIVLMPIIPSGWMGTEAFQEMDLLRLGYMLTMEVLLGLTLALAVLILIEVFHISGYVVDRDAGFTMAEVIDPVTHINASLFSGIFVQIFYIMFIIQDGHHEVIKIAAASFQTIPPGQFLIDNDIVNTVIYMSSHAFVVAMQLAMPIMVAMLFVNIALGLLARIGEGFQVLMISFPVRFGLSFIILMWTFPTITSFCRQVNEELFGWFSYIARL